MDPVALRIPASLGCMEFRAAPATATSPTSPTTPTVAVRSARVGEAAALAGLAAATFPDACPPEMPPADIEDFIAEHLSVRAFAGYLADPRFLVLVAEPVDAAGPDAPLLGYTLLDLSPVEEPPTDWGTANAYLSKMYVRDTARGTGAASALMRATLDAARRRGHRRVWLGVNQANTRAGAFYGKLGFEVVGERTFAVGGATGTDHLRAVEL